MTVLPYKEDSSGKKEQVARMFDGISGNYDFLNHFLSLGIDIAWRRKAIAQLKDLRPVRILDVATGTGDFAIEALRLRPEKIIGIDISNGMLEIGRQKMRSRCLEQWIELRKADSENLPFENDGFDAVTVGFGVRNFEHPEQGLSEIFRVLRPGGKLVVLEFSTPTSFPFRHLYRLYFNFVLPRIGRWISSDKAAYTYLPKSVRAFPDGKNFTDILARVGFKQTSCKPLTFGISSMYTGVK